MRLAITSFYLISFDFRSFLAGFVSFLYLYLVPDSLRLPALDSMEGVQDSLGQFAVLYEHN